MVKKYIIKINCTSIIELAYNGKIISKKKDIPESILEDLKKDVLDKIGININKILIICRRTHEGKNSRRTREGKKLKTLQFEYESENELNREEFVNFIKILKSFNFNPYEEKDDEINENKIKKKFNKNRIRYIELIRYIDENEKHREISITIFEYIYETETETQKINKQNRSYDYKTIPLYNNK